MKLLALLFPLLGLIGFAGYVWLTVVAFKKSAVWGVCVLLLSPFSAIVFAVKHWEESKRPFLVFVASGSGVLAVAVLMVVGVGSTLLELGEPLAPGGFEPTDVAAVVPEPIADEPDELDPAAQAVASADPVDVPDPVVVELAGSVASLTHDSNLPAVDPLDVLDGFRPIRQGEATKLIGQYVRAVDTQGNQLGGTLVRADAEGVVLERYIPSGTFAIELRSREIKSLHVAIR